MQKTKPPSPRGRSWSNLPNEESRKKPTRDSSSHRLQPVCREQGTQAQQGETRLEDGEEFAQIALSPQDFTE